MTQNKAAVRIDTVRQLPRVKETLREETERSLGEIAYVLQLTGRVKQAILQEKVAVRAN